MNTVINLPMHKLRKKEEKLLSQNLIMGETILGTAVGILNQAIVITDKKVMIIKTGWMSGQTFGGKVTIFSYNQISAVEVKTKLLGGTLIISGGGVQGYERKHDNSAPNMIPFANVQLEAFQKAANYIREHVSNVSNSNNISSNDSVDVFEKIRKLAELKNQQIISEEEYNTKKKDLLSRV